MLHTNNHIIYSFWYLISLLIILGIIKLPWFKGIIGEFAINFSARWLLDKNKYHLIKNVLLPTENGTTQIDHIIVSVYGVFVIETKNMKGWIFGSANQPYWTQKIYKHTSKFQNPLRQNYKHTKTLESLLNLHNGQIYSVIVFVGESTFKTEMPENVTTGSDYARYIKSKNEHVLTESQVAKIIEKIESKKLKSSFKASHEHINHVKTIKESREGKMSRNQSPLEDFIDIMTKLPWWVNLILAFISYAILHSYAMSFYDPAPKDLDVGKMGAYAVSKLYPSIALFAQFAIPFALVIAGFGGVIKKCKRANNYKELAIYICLVAIIFGTIVHGSGGVNKSMMDRTRDPRLQNTTSHIKNNPIKYQTNREDEAMRRAELELEGGNQKKDATENKPVQPIEPVKVYTWINENGQKIYSNKPRSAPK